LFRNVNYDYFIVNKRTIHSYSKILKCQTSVSYSFINKIFRINIYVCSALSFITWCRLIRITCILSKDIISLTDNSVVIKFNNLGLFPLLVYEGKGQVDIIYYTTPEKINLITKLSSNFKAIAGLSKKGAPVKFKDLNSESFSKGKVVKLEDICSITDINDIVVINFIGHNIANYYSFTFYPPEVIDILHNSP